MERQEFRSKLEDLMPAEELLFQPTPGFGPFYEPYLDHAKSHPAKMNTWLLEWLIKAFTKPGETVLDPMAGSGSTGVVAALHGRNAVQVELEKKFYDWMEKAKQNVEKNDVIEQKGWIKNILGDARCLSQLLHDVDLCLTSPPYSEGIGHDSGDNAGEQFKERLEMQRRYTRQMVSEGNIAKLQHGEISAIISSPPFGDGYSIREGGQVCQEYVERRRQKLIEQGRKDIAENLRTFEYSARNPSNIGNLPFGNVDTIITSPPFGDSYTGGGDPEKRRQRLIKAGHNPKDFLGGKARNAVLKHYNEVDTVITSPPYANQEVGKGIRANRWEKIKNREGFKGRKEWKAGTPSHYSDNPENIGNLPLGEISTVMTIDTIVTSPPYSESMTKKRKGYTVIPELAKTREMPQDTSDDNTANLPHGSIDAVITSPPYKTEMRGAGLNKDDRGLELGCKWDGYSRNRDNLDNLSYGSIDAVITSPPYCDTISRQGGPADVKNVGISTKTAREYSPNPENIGNLPHGSIDTIITSPPYADGKKAGEVKPEEVEKYAKRWEENVEKRGWNSWGKSFHTPGRLRGIQALRDGYSENRENIGNLPFVDCCITSPPYEASVSDGKESPLVGADEKKYGRWRKGTAQKHSYTEHGEPCKVDIVITSPPYEGSLEGSTRHTRGGIASRDPALSQTGTYSEISPTIQRLRRHGRSNPKHGGPYGRSLAHPYTEFPTVMSFGVPVGYSPNKENIGNLKSSDEEYEALARGLMKNGKPTYLSEMLRVYGEMFRVLKPGGLVIIVVKPFIRNKKVVDLPYHTWLLMMRVGFRLAKLYKLRLKQQSFWRILLYKKHPDVPLIAHEYVLVCQKPVSEHSEVEPQISPLDFIVEMVARETAFKIGA